MPEKSSGGRPPKVDRVLMDVLKVIKYRLGTPIKNRGFDWYDSVSTSKPDDLILAIYKIAINSDGYKSLTITLLDKIEKTKGYTDVDNHVARVGIGTKRLELLYDLAIVDLWASSVN